MMVADTSALVAIVTNEPERSAFYDAMINDGEVLVSTANAVEFLIVAFGRGNAVYQNATNLLKQPFITLVPPGDAEIWAAASAHQTYGRGHHPAQLNFGDTFAYALASTRGLPLLFKGDDFARTDIAAAV